MVHRYFTSAPVHPHLLRPGGGLKTEIWALRGQLEDAFDAVYADMIGPAGGDLYGTYPNPLVGGLCGHPIDTVGHPLNGDVLAFNSLSNQWEHVPLTFGGGPPVGPAGGDLGGLYPNPTVVKLYGFDLDSTAPVGGDSLVWDGGLSKWSPHTLAADTTTATNNSATTGISLANATPAINAITMNGFYMFDSVELPSTVQGTIDQTVASIVPLRQPGIPRPLKVTFPAGWAGGSITAYGTGRLGAAVSETFVKPVGGGTVDGTVPFYFTTSFVNNAPGGILGTTASITLHDGYAIPDASIVAFVKVTVDGTAATFASANITTGVFEPNEPHHGNHSVCVWYTYSITPSQVVHNHAVTDTGHNHTQNGHVHTLS